MSDRKLSAIFFGSKVEDCYLECAYSYDVDYTHRQVILTAYVPRGIVPTTSGNMVPVDEHRRCLVPN